jgi:hypothetical protein
MRFYDTFMSPSGCACITGASRARAKLALMNRKNPCK